MTEAICAHCDGESLEADYQGPEMKCVGVPCSECDGKGKLTVGVFQPICARHCTVCDSDDHHWMPYGYPDENDNPLMACKHCPALRPWAAEEDEENEWEDA